MLTLVSVCAQKVVSDHASLRLALNSVPRELYPPLFTAAFLGRKTLALRDLVRQWPFSILSFQQLLPGDPGQLHPNLNQACTQAIILGIMDHLNGATPERGQQLRLLDMTGAHNFALEQGPDAMSLWSHTVTLAKVCADLSKRCRHEAGQAAKRRRGHSDSTLAPPTPLDSTHVEIWTDLYVDSTSYLVLQEALQASKRGPLRLRCRNLRAEELSLRSTAGLLEILDSAGLRQIDLCQIDLRCKNFGLDGLNTILPAMAKFGALRSLKLPYNIVDVRRLTPDKEDALKKFAALIGELRSLKELNLGSSRLSGRLRQLLGGVQQPLESLELAFCSLLPVDLHYLSGSLHVSVLKKLDLTRNNLSELLPPFQQLLAAVAPSLLHLEVMECNLSDSALSALVPALCRCSRLRYLGLFCNPLSSQGLRTLLQNCVRLRELRLVVCPYPADCYGDEPDLVLPYGLLLGGCVDPEKLAQFSAELQEMLVQAERTDMVWTTDKCVHRNLDYLDLYCQ